MNDKILKLASDAGLLNYNDLETPRRYFVCGYADVEEVRKFAESIIQECLAMTDWQTGQRIQKHFEYRDNRWAETQHNPKPF